MKFSQKVILASSMLLLISIVLLSVQQSLLVKDKVEKLVESSLMELEQGVRDAVSAQMESKRALAKSTQEIIELAPLDQGYVADVLETSVVKQGFIAVGLGYERDGLVVENDDAWEVESSYDPRTRPWYQQAKAQNRLVVTEPYVDSTTKQVVISIGAPVRSQEQFIGSLFYDVDLGGLAKLVNQTNLFDAGYLFIVTPDGTTIAHPDVNKNGENISSYLPQVRIQEGEQRFEKEGVSYLVRLTKVGSEGWFVGAVLNESTVYSAISEMRSSSLIYVVIAVVLSVLALSVLMKALMRPLGALNAAIQDIASGNGDLTKRLDTNTDPEFAEMARGFNRFTENLQQQVIQSKAISADILNGTEMSVMGAERASSAVGSQLQELEQLATAMHEMSVTALEVANNAQSAAHAVKEADQVTSAGSKVVSDTTNAISQLSLRIDQAVEEVQGLESATTNIETILKVINEIAEQTNLLALNAAIEAARAGESGRGFAVVADEVRTLASRTQESTTQIRSMIEQLQAGASSVSSVMGESKATTDVAVTHAQQADHALQEIREIMQRITDMNLQIASAAEEQSLVAEEINSNTVRIKDLSTEVSQLAAQSNDAMAQQTVYVRQQDALLNKFIV
ncbi:methyl-accepting chemotaxis protein [Vibrio vulnificus]|uniref:methyl-accepting chemotaxis protein n=1 Tax=Vibrio vulnificus TaxID=672 RepID=UPI000D3E9662|nr:methyl-accepting chemotaxis protein [Vibrio vulnificus]MCJ0813714.1 methyl-accepting chemotaxis protein [Vibrio vulnificus]MCR9703466.1 methyl-accepting chemotaxis protein [Vibrio vulnificus]MDT8803625.1 methyl-accepting chemotaxis protein [Vibrio vulnificus]PUZ98437.1 chemotaxis protein [Vibrio vulnificus]BDP29834.1 methyl-accepting chemotaxis protein [Vibrio vulnificus]